MTDRPKDGGPAFPAIPGDMAQGPCCHWGGMSLRDWFAGQALNAAWQGFDKGYYEGDSSDIAECAYQIGDAMMKARESRND